MGVLVLVGIAVAMASAADESKVAVGGDPYRVSSERLRASLADTGLQIRYMSELKDEGLPSVVGVASAGKESIGFEFQIYSSSDSATVRMAGKLRARDLGWPRKYESIRFQPWMRGVLGNVAFAEYEESELEPRGVSIEETHQRQRAHQRMLRAIDRALFDAFPPSDPYVHALSTESE